ncbi:hypothetical protein XENOCAPTIV_023934 [Xenoophorus captivus]|uniref:Uncharacterized protein n=1 Tax=Xenoophorus captivus TaxID=1517983 RepID=A0ABV0QE76_9TELE
MFPSLAHRPWHVFCRVSLQHRSSLYQWFPRGWQSRSLHGSWFSLPDSRVASLGLTQVQYYSTSGDGKDGPPKSESAKAPPAEKVTSGAAKVTPTSSVIWSSSERSEGEAPMTTQRLSLCFCGQTWRPS